MATKKPTAKDPREITLDGEPYTFDLSLGAFRIAQERHGVALGYGDLLGLPFGVQLRLMWIGLLPGRPELTEAEGEALWEAASDEERDRWHALMIAPAYRYVQNLNRAAEALAPPKAGKKQAA